MKPVLQCQVGFPQGLAGFGDVTYIDSSGIGELVSSFTTTTNQGGSLNFST